MMRELSRDVDKLSCDLTSQTRSNVMYVYEFFLAIVHRSLNISSTAREANRRRTLVDEMKQIKEDIETQMNQGYNTTGSVRMMFLIDFW